MPCSSGVICYECKDGSLSENSVWHTTLTKRRIKIIWSSPKMPKKLLTKSNAHLWWTKLNKVGIEKNNQHNKSHIWKTHSQHYTQWWKAESTPSKIRNKARMPTPTTFIQYGIRSPSHSNQTRRGNKRHPDWKGRSKTVAICRWHILLIENPKDSIKKQLELINEFSKVAGYKVNREKYFAFFIHQ